MNIANAELSQVKATLFGDRPYVVHFFSHAGAEQDVTALFSELTKGSVGKKTIVQHVFSDPEPSDGLYPVLYLRSIARIDRHADLEHPELFLGQRGRSAIRLHYFVPMEAIRNLMRIMGTHFMGVATSVQHDVAEELRVIAPLEEGQFMNALFLGSAPYVPSQIADLQRSA